MHCSSTRMMNESGGGELASERRHTYILEWERKAFAQHLVIITSQSNRGGCESSSCALASVDSSFSSSSVGTCRRQIMRSFSFGIHLFCRQILVSCTSHRICLYELRDGHDDIALSSPFLTYIRTSS